MTATLSEAEILVLRFPQDQGNYTYSIGEMSAPDARRLKERLALQDRGFVAHELNEHFGRQMTLNEAMSHLTARDYQVLDCPLQST